MNASPDRIKDIYYILGDYAGYGGRTKDSFVKTNYKTNYYGRSPVGERNYRGDQEVFRRRIKGR